MQNPPENNVFPIYSNSFCYKMVGAKFVYKIILILNWNIISQNPIETFILIQIMTSSVVYDLNLEVFLHHCCTI